VREPQPEPEPPQARAVWPEARWNGWAETPAIAGVEAMRTASTPGAGGRVRSASAPRLSLGDAGTAGVFSARGATATSWLTPAPAPSSPDAAVFATASRDAGSAMQTPPVGAGPADAPSASPSRFPWSVVAGAAETQGDAAPAGVQWVDARDVRVDPSPVDARPASPAAAAEWAPVTTRLAASTAELSALLQSQVTPDAAAPAFAGWDEPAAVRASAIPFPPSPGAGAGVTIPAAADVPQPATHAFDAPTFAASPAFGDAAAPLARRVPAADPVAEFEAMASMDPAEAAAAEEMLVDRILDRMNDRMRDESIRRFGLTGGVI
jgi:hypothetical protein